MAAAEILVMPRSVSRSLKRATVPVTAGVAIDVPCVVQVPLFVWGMSSVGGPPPTDTPKSPSEVTFVPLAMMSGLIRPSSVGPKLEKPAMSALPFIAPTVMTFLAEATGPTQSESKAAVVWRQSTGCPGPPGPLPRSLPADFRMTSSVP